MIDIKIIASGSAGNAYLVSDQNHKILIECGIDFTKLRQALNFKTPTLDAVLISHEHKDHAKSARQLTRIGVPMIMSEGTRQALEIDPAFAVIAKSQTALEVGPWRLLPFDVEHDAAEPIGFLIMSPSGKKILYATDTAFLRWTFTGVNHFLIETNYSEKYLVQNENIDDFLKDRIRRSHFELDNCIEFLKSCDLSSAEKIHLLHLSNDNADRQEFIGRVMAETGIPAY